MCGNEKLPGYYPWPDLTMCGNENWQFNTPDLTWQCVQMKSSQVTTPDLTWQCVRMKSCQVTTPDLTGLQAGVSWAVRWAAPQARTLHLPQWVEAGPRHSQQEAESPIVFFVILCNFNSFLAFWDKKLFVNKDLDDSLIWKPETVFIHTEDF